MPEPPPPETLSWLRHAASCGQRDAQLTLRILERLEALERKYETQRLATLEWGKDVDKLMRWSDKHLQRIMALEQRPIPGTVELAADHLADASKMVPTPDAAPPVAPAGGVVERVANVLGHYGDASARAAIREVAAWLRENEFGYHAALSLEQEAGR